MKTIKLISVIMIMLISLSACTLPGLKKNANEGGNQVQRIDSNYPVDIIDFSGRKVTFSQKPQRVVSLSPAVAEIIFGLGNGDSIVGVTEEEVYPAEAKGKQKVGSYSNIDLDLIKSLNPDVVFASKYTYQHMVEQLREAKINVVFAESETYNGIFDSIGMLSKIFVSKENGDKLTDGIKQKIIDISNKTPEYRPNVLYIQSVEPLYVAGSKTLINDTIWLAGGANIAQDISGYAQMDVQKLNGRRVDVIVLSNNLGPEVNTDYFRNHVLFKDLDAVKNNKIFRVTNEELYVTPSPHITDAIEEMYKLIFNGAVK